LISQTRRRVERYSRQGDGFWLFSETLRPDEEIRIEALGVTLRLDELYGGVLPPDAVPDGANHSGEG
jgi:Uma2 family endonuclease